MLQQREKRKTMREEACLRDQSQDGKRHVLRDQSQHGKMLDMRGRDAIVRVMETGMNEFG